MQEGYKLGKSDGDREEGMEIGKEVWKKGKARWR